MEMNIVIELLSDPKSPYMWILVITLIAGAIASISRPFLSFLKFVYPNAKYEATGNPYITQVSLQRLLESGTLQAFIEQLNGNKDYQIQGTTAYEVQHNLDNVLVKTIEQMKKDNSKKMHLFYDKYLEYHDSRYVKTALKLKRKEKTIDETILQHIVSPQVKQLVSQLSSAERESLPDILKDYGFPSSFLLLMHDDEIDAGIDRFFIRRLDEVHVPYKCQQAKHLYVKRLIDVISIQLILRAKHRHLNETSCMSFFIDDGYEIPEWKFKELCKANDVSEVITILEGTSYASTLKHVKDTIKTTFVQPYEDALDQYMLTVIKDISTQHYTTIGPSLRYLISKEIEIKNLKIIAKGLYEQMPIESIRSLLRMETSA
jgi:V/A-type H+-transporting ATPase subunit C